MSQRLLWPLKAGPEVATISGVHCTMFLYETVEISRADLSSHLQREKETKTELEEGRLALAESKDILIKLNEADKVLEKNFKKEFPGFNYNQLEALLKCYR